MSIGSRGKVDNCSAVDRRRERGSGDGSSIGRPDVNLDRLALIVNVFANASSW